MLRRGGEGGRRRDGEGRVKAILSILWKEFLQLRRDPRLFPVIFISPILQLLLLGYAANLDVKNIPSVVCDMDRSAESRGFLDEFVNSGYFTVAARVERMDEIDRYLDNGDAAMAFVIPRGFGDDVAAGRRGLGHAHRRRLGEPIGDDRRQLRDDDRGAAQPEDHPRDVRAGPGARLEAGPRQRRGPGLVQPGAQQPEFHGPRRPRPHPDDHDHGARVRWASSGRARRGRWSSSS